MFEFEEIIPNEEVQAKLNRLMDLFKKAKIEQVFNILFLLVGVGYNTPKNQFCLESDLLQILNSDVNQFAQKDNRQEIDF